MGVKLRVVADRVARTASALDEMTRTRVMIGIPAQKAGRDETEDEEINNATLMAIHENGAPEVNIPARPVLGPTVKEIRPRIVDMLHKAAEAAMSGDTQTMRKQFIAIGLMAQNEMRRRITVGPFVPLSPRTLAERRARGRKGTKPLIDTGQLRRALTYVIRDSNGNDI